MAKVGLETGTGVVWSGILGQGPHWYRGVTIPQDATNPSEYVEGRCLSATYVSIPDAGTGDPKFILTEDISADIAAGTVEAVVLIAGGVRAAGLKGYVANDDLEALRALGIFVE